MTPFIDLFASIYNIYTCIWNLLYCFR